MFFFLTPLAPADCGEPHEQKPVTPTTYITYSDEACTVAGEGLRRKCGGACTAVACTGPTCGDASACTTPACEAEVAACVAVVDACAAATTIAECYAAGGTPDAASCDPLECDKLTDYVVCPDGGCVRSCVDLLDSTSDAWSDSTGKTCFEYEQLNLCTPAGDYGSGWDSALGTFAEYKVQGVDASQACCACGGGSGGAAAV